MITGEVCRSCDGRKYRTKPGPVDGSKIDYMCSVCNGTGINSAPSKGGKRRFSKPQEDSEDPSLEEQTLAFLRKHGC